MESNTNQQKYVNIISRPYWRNEYVLQWMKERNVYPDELRKDLKMSPSYAKIYFYRPFHRAINRQHWLQILDYFKIDERELPVKMADLNPANSHYLKTQMRKYQISFPELGRKTGLSGTTLHKMVSEERAGSETSWTKIYYFFQELDENSGKI